MRYHEPTKVYVARRIAEGKTKPETSAASNATSHAKPGHSYAHSAAQQPPKQRVDVYRSINSQGAALGTGTRTVKPCAGVTTRRIVADRWAICTKVAGRSFGCKVSISAGIEHVLVEDAHRVSDRDQGVVVRAPQF